MPPRRKRLDPAKQAALLEKIRRERASRETGYREQALKLFPHVCGRCGREFSGAKLRELTVHHKDHNHMNNPPDGSNWELLCVYCHDAEHQTPEQRAQGSGTQLGIQEPTLGHQPFAGLFKTSDTPDAAEESG